ncbi:TetR/AcrR family transcriptional regulator [Actinocrispum wychmicini]|uniref:TetR family transcriptional regulator n=1 Tax=Actinocrispum wychmicini TaxID=1213861 RepID=A0A4R2JRX7_9PSEU|nr:TetR/AcrR family transcriptional regulator [Actinocrispum wychmicini]TCO62314.1 TetR family transcriptional regulator [Actinocrispum wychmicini]
MTQTAAEAPKRPMRADARRNYGHLLAAAKEAFAQHGAEASLNEIATRAGVGVGTLYRHFPSREALLAAVLQDRFDALTAKATELVRTVSAAEALRGWLLVFIAHLKTYRGLSAPVMSTLNDETSELYSSCHAMRASGTELVARAQDAGDLRKDVDSADVLILANAIAWATEQLPEDPVRTDRLLSIVLSGLRRESD